MNAGDTSMEAPVPMSPYQLGQLVATIDQLTRRIERFETQVADRMDRYERSTDRQLGEMANTLKAIAEGYIRREDHGELKEDVDGVAETARDALEKANEALAALAVLTERQRPISEAFNGVLKWAVGIALAVGMFIAGREL